MKKMIKGRNIGISKEDYLRAIYELTQENYSKKENKEKKVKLTDIAKKLGITKPSVSQMIKKLTKEGYISSKKYSAITLTDKGGKIAAKLVKRHMIVEIFLKEMLKCPKNKIKKESHILEHAFSDEILKRIDKILKHPKKSIAGKKIPR